MFVFFHVRGHGGILFWWRRSTASLRSIYVSAGVRPEAWDGRARSANLRLESGRIDDARLIERR